MNWNLTEYNSGAKLVNKPTGVVLKLGSSGHLNSIYAETEVKLNQIISVAYRVTTLEGKPQFISMDGGALANFSAMICKNTALDGRWYVSGDPKTVCAILQPSLDKGILHYGVKLDQAFWQDVNGKQNAAGFKQGVAQAKILEIVFGGKFRAHGIQVQNGKVKIELTVSIT